MAAYVRRVVKFEQEAKLQASVIICDTLGGIFVKCYSSDSDSNDDAAMHTSDSDVGMDSSDADVDVDGN